METKRIKFIKDGFIKIDQLITPEEVDSLGMIYDELLQDKVKTAHLRSDLAGADNNADKKVERITQIMRPSTLIPELLEKSSYKKAEQWAKDLLGDDMELDFDMMINKAPYTNTPTPWHQDAAYWIAMPDKRSASCWIALDEVYEKNGCMWFIPKTTGIPILPHKNLPNGGALYCETDSSQALSIPLNPGGCTFHDGFTLHFSQGNTTETQRRALILNFRPKKMIEFEREQGVDHTGERKQRN
ncbi:phytanoyl-CoA dioxygenase family protein [Arenibacter sp. M-2]|uniref:phytanoyl-CoA dioxygenase family protein n=1 Tax=Arenibacter sp. M-2 TaxID=3053612 RepID=UPI0025706B18|nr:phytanoyl-CoA dioxygenase family protein [Arenibacter sp. M-2]MDL5513356.1 phytanoyl-CoA dioxygenase family protein [Arenibacter sp. M-2]|tara:strand:+ start:6360 stop:7088 length:729 start_codon:yes stop_codon:yes gene_type:complete